MSEENDLGQGAETGDVGTGEGTAAQPTIEEIARAIGYRSKEEMKDPSKHVDAAEYIKRTAKFNDSYRQEIKHLKRSIDGITNTVAQVAVQKHAEGVREAEARLAKAKAEFDADGVEEATKEVIRLKQATPQASATEPPEVTDFCERNAWFDKDEDMTADALVYRKQYLDANPNAPIAKVLAYMEKKIRKDYPEHFEATSKKEDPPQRKAPAAGPEGAVGTNHSGKEAWEKFEKELSDFERNTMNALCGQMHNGKPVMTKKQYIDNLAASGRFGR